MLMWKRSDRSGTTTPVFAAAFFLADAAASLRWALPDAGSAPDFESPVPSTRLLCSSLLASELLYSVGCPEALARSLQIFSNLFSSSPSGRLSLTTRNHLVRSKLGTHSNNALVVTVKALMVDVAMVRSRESRKADVWEVWRTSGAEREMWRGVWAPRGD